jgi:tRNA G18 (ribose-2'-O)-methylase SpoU
MGAEDYGLSPRVLSLCHDVVQIPSVEAQSMNVAVAGSLVIYDRFAKAVGESA